MFIFYIDIAHASHKNFLFFLFSPFSNFFFVLNNDLIYVLHQNSNDLINQTSWKYLYHNDTYSFFFTINETCFNLNTNFAYFYKTIFIKNKSNNLLWLSICLFLITIYNYFKIIIIKYLKYSVRMLFKQIYNWIRYKTIPTSILFKNRLFWNETRNTDEFLQI